MTNQEIHGHYLEHSLYLHPVAEGLEITADTTDEEATVVLHPEAVRNLRLALQRYERTYRQEGKM